MKKRAITVFVVFVLCSSLTIPVFASATVEEDFFASQLLEEDTEDDTITEVEIQESANSDKPLSDKQLSSIAMLNHLTVLSKEINSSSNSRVYLDNAYSDIVNNTNPNAVDEDSLYEIKSLLDTIHAYQSIAVKRSRLAYIYEQSQAQAMRKAIPNPMTILNIVESRNLIKGLISVVYMAVDSKNNYNNYMSEAESKYLEDSWILDDEAADNLHDSRSNAFTYMIEMCQKNDIDKDMALNEKSVDDFVKWENNPNITRKIDFFEKNQSTYEAYGKYWLVLAESYYEQNEYDKCLDAIETYKEMNIDTFRKDHDLAKTLTKGIVAARECKSDDEYVDYAGQALEIMTANIENENWSMLYFAASTYMELFTLTNDKKYLETAYSLTDANVNNLIDTQLLQNKTYLEPITPFSLIKKKETYKKSSKEKQKEMKEYYEFLEAERKIELPPVYEPLVLNCDLLFGLAEELQVSDEEKRRINNMLYPDSQPLFLVDALNTRYGFDNEIQTNQTEVEFAEDKLIIPVAHILYGSSIRVTVDEAGKSKVYEDWEVSNIDREDESNINTFKAEYKSKSIKDQEFSQDTTISVEIISPENMNIPTQQFIFKAVPAKKLFVFDDLQYEMVN